MIQSLYPELNDYNLAQLVEVFHKSNPEGEEFAFAYYSEVALRIRQQGKAGITALWNEIDKANTDQLRAILLALTMPTSKYPKLEPLENQDLVKLHSLLKKWLEHRESLIVAEAIDGLGYLEEKSVLNQVLKLRDHPSPYVRGSVLRYMSKLWPKQSFQLLIEALNDQHFIVRENAVDELGELGRLDAIPHIQPLLADEHPDVRQAAQTALETLS